MRCQSCGNQAYATCYCSEAFCEAHLWEHIKKKHITILSTIEKHQTERNPGSPKVTDQKETLTNLELNQFVSGIEIEKIKEELSKVEDDPTKISFKTLQMIENTGKVIKSEENQTMSDQEKTESFDKTGINESDFEFFTDEIEEHTMGFQFLHIEQKGYIYKLLGSVIGEKLCSVIDFCIEKKMLTSQEAIHFLFPSSFILFKSNESRTYVQIGGSVAYVFFLLILNIFHDVKYFSKNTIEEERDLCELNSFCQQYDIIVKPLTETLESGASFVVCCSSFSDYISLFETDHTSCELFLPKGTNFKDTSRSIFTEDFFISMGNNYYLTVHQNFKKNKEFKILVLCDRQKFDEIHYINKLYHLKSKTKLQNFDELVNQLSLMYECPQKNHVKILKKFTQLYLLLYVSALEYKNIGQENPLELTGTIFQNDDSKKYLILLNSMNQLANFRVYSKICFFIIYRTVLSSTMVNLFIEIGKSGLAIDLMICLASMDELNTRSLEPLVKSTLFSIFEKMILQNERSLQLMRIIDNKSNNEDILEDKINILQKEFDEIKDLIPNYVLIHSPQLGFTGKTLLGGHITIASNHLINDPRSKVQLASFITIIRHELCYLKWYVKPSKLKFFSPTPPFEDIEEQEADYYIDVLAFGNFDPRKVFIKDKITEEIAEKILKMDSFSENELEAVFVLPGMKEIKSMCRAGGYQRFCSGRIHDWNFEL